ncbi:hypothetical protein ABIB35_003124 [Arthrobacter sp. UYP6]|uniref:hypothetical protein n=1 Tax=Arthrobacter sp. UYP6 TaxID=1756378 RepID=UPI003398E9AE
MSTHPSVFRRRQSSRFFRRAARLRGWAVLLLSLLLVAAPLAAPANARINSDGPVRNGLPSEVTDIVITSLGAGQAVTGALPPVGAEWPVASYPTSIPPDYVTDNVSFAGIINTEDVTGTNTAQMYCIDLRTETRIGLG